MAESYKRLNSASVVNTANTAFTGNVATNTSLSTYTIVSSILICNTSSVAGAYTIATTQSSGGFGTNPSYIANGANIAANDTVILVCGVCLDPTNAPYLVASTGAQTAVLSFSAYGVTGP
jgi:hypothetical protein